VYDVCIVGAGPAGSTLARLMPPHLRVLLVDRRRLDHGYERGMRGKACGGLLAPAAQRELARQGLGVPTNIIAGPQLFAVRTIDAQAELVRHYQRFYLNVDREAFDRWLLSLIPDRFDTLLGFSVHAVDATQEQPLLRLRGPNGESASVCARLVVGADGAGSVIASSLGRGLERSGYTAIQGAFEGASADPYYGAFFDETLTDFYGWSIPKGDATYVGIALRHGRGAGQRFDDLVERLRKCGCSLGAPLLRQSAPLRRPSRPGHVVLGNDPVVLVGEAAGLISASSAEGISYALRSARILAGALEDGLSGAGSRYRMGMVPVVGDVIGKIWKSRVLYDTGARRLIMQSGVTAIREASGTRSAGKVRLREV
jgi:geranylgeranyl diphosphate/geranylgeranyl-bacteriochlorophyllide a reductase